MPAQLSYLRYLTVPVVDRHIALLRASPNSSLTHFTHRLFCKKNNLHFFRYTIIVSVCSSSTQSIFSIIESLTSTHSNKLSNPQQIPRPSWSKLVRSWKIHEGECSADDILSRCRCLWRYWPGELSRFALTLLRWVYTDTSLQPLSLLCKACPLIKELSLYDVVNTPGVATDLSHISTPAVSKTSHWGHGRTSEA